MPLPQLDMTPSYEFWNCDPRKITTALRILHILRFCSLFFSCSFECWSWYSAVFSLDCPHTWVPLPAMSPRVQNWLEACGDQWTLSRLSWKQMYLCELWENLAHSEGDEYDGQTTETRTSIKLLCECSNVIHSITKGLKFWFCISMYIHQQPAFQNLFRMARNQACLFLRKYYIYNIVIKTVTAMNIKDGKKKKTTEIVTK